MRSLVSAPLGPSVAAETPAPARTWADFETIYREHFRFVWRTVRRLGIEGALVDDVVQEVFVVVHRRLGDFEGRSAAKTWLYGIVRRVVADHRRTMRRKPLGTAPEGEGLDAASTPETGPEASAEQAERVRLLHQLLSQLDEAKREVFILAELEGLTLAEIAEALGVNANTVASRLRVARREFEAALEEQRRPR
jgi:RNA polymerase sigma-70 factor (ECF subfamily)